MTDHILSDPTINQADPIVMYLIVRESLDMGMGKTAAQCAHASQMLMMKYMRSVWDHTGDVIDGNLVPAPEKLIMFKNWLNTSYRKVVLRANEKDWAMLKVLTTSDLIDSQFSDYVLVIDAGLTEIAPNSETVIGLWPMRKSEVPKSIKRLQVLK